MAEHYCGDKSAFDHPGRDGNGKDRLVNWNVIWPGHI